MRKVAQCQMEWNFVPECISLGFTIILIIYARPSGLMPSIRSRVHDYCLYATALTSMVSIYTMYNVNHLASFPIILMQLFFLMTYILAPITTALFLLYIAAVIWEDQPRFNLISKIIFIPYVLYVLVVLTNPLNHWIILIEAPATVSFGKGYFLAFLLSTGYAIAQLSMILAHRKKLERELRLALLSFPIIAFAFTLIQGLYPDYLMMGTASTMGLLIMSFYFQNKKTMLDNLTSLQNREVFLKRLRQMIRQRTEGKIILVSLDNFKDFNDNFGQDKGDLALKTISQYLTREIPRHYIFRYSGDEFALFFGAGSRLNPDRIARHLNERFHQPWYIDQLSCDIRASIAVAALGQPTSTEEMISLLEYCVERSKQSGKARIIEATSAIISDLKRKNQVIEIMRRALDHDGFEVYYQPIFCLAQRRFTSAEALLRLQDEHLGSISPAEFIPLAEKSGLIYEIGYLVLDKVCQFIRQLTDQGIEIENISVNFSILQILDAGIHDYIINTIHKHQIAADKIGIEITEGVFIDNHEYIKALIRKLGFHGIKFYLDDFGTGYSNLANVIQLKFDCIKLDKSILYYSTTNESYFGLLAGMIKIFSDLGLKVIIEGVENQLQQDVVEKNKAQYVQGFLFARPMTAADMILCFSAQADAGLLKDPELVLV